MSEKSLMKLASDLGVSFSAAKIISDHVRAEYNGRLQGADALCEAAKDVMVIIDEDEAITTDEAKPLRKAIADYEGKEEA
jgi:hypothetical protein